MLTDEERVEINAELDNLQEHIERFIGEIHDKGPSMNLKRKLNGAIYARAKLAMLLVDLDATLPEEGSDA